MYAATERTAVHPPPPETPPRRPLDALVIGAGQAGLAVGYHLARHGVRFLLVDAAPEIGHSWAGRWDSLRLFTPAEYSALPGMAFPAAPGTYPGKDQVADYLKAYAARFDLPVMPDTRVGPPGHRGHRSVSAAGNPEPGQRIRLRGDPAPQLDLPEPE
jgi:putative flavoprotein involved in K+ transport